MNKLNILKKKKKIFIVLSNLVILLQIFFILLVILFSLYMFLQLMQNHAMDFMNPLVALAKNLIHSVFGNTLKSSRTEIDGNLAAFIIIQIILVIVCSQLKMVLKCQDEIIDKKIVEQKAIEQELFNRQLKMDLQKSIRSYNCFMIGVTMNAATLIAESLQIYGAEKVDVNKIRSEAMVAFIKDVNSATGLKIAKEGDTLVINCTNFDSVDNLMTIIQNALSIQKKQCKEKMVTLRTRVAIETYKANTPLKQVYATIKPLLELNAGSDILCYGNFNNRYAMLKNPKFNIIVKGKYDIEGAEQTIYALVKKN